MKTIDEIKQKIRDVKFTESFDMIVAIANGGIVPAAMLAQILQVDVQLLKINWRNAKQQPQYEAPQLLAPVNFNYRGKNILLVEDRVKTGATLNFAKQMLQQEAKQVKTFAVNGPADYSLYNETCFKFPWLL
ncbi:MAG: phosphoribosyltransferase [Niabella sp.]